MTVLFVLLSLIAAFVEPEVVLLVAALIAPGQPAGAQAAPAPAGRQTPGTERFDFAVRSDFFAGFAGDAGRLQRAMDRCEQALAEDPRRAEALVWHGAGLGFQAGQGFRRGDRETGIGLWSRAIEEMNRAVGLEPDNVGVRIPRGATLLEATRGMSPEMSRPLLEMAVSDYEHTLELQSAYFATLGDHPKGELLFGLAEGSARLGRAADARRYFERLVQEAPASGQAPKARLWLETGTFPEGTTFACTGCHR